MTFSNCPLDIADSDCLVRRIGKGHNNPLTLSSLSKSIFNGIGLIIRAQLIALINPC